LLQFKSQAERYKDISVDLASLIEDAVERFGRWDAQPTISEKKSQAEDGMDAESSDEESEDEDEDMVSANLRESEHNLTFRLIQLTSPMSIALAELALLNTSIPFHTLHKALYPITRSLPLILHHKQSIANLLVKALSIPDRVDLALSVPHIIDIIPSFIQCLTPDPDFKQLQLDTILTPLMRAVVGLAVDPPSVHTKTSGDRGNDPNSPVEISKRAFQVLAWTFRQIGSDLVNGADYQHRHQVAWSWVVDGLSGSKPSVSLPEEVTDDEKLSFEQNDEKDEVDEEEDHDERPQLEEAPLEQQADIQVETVDAAVSAEEAAEVDLADTSDSESTAEDDNAHHRIHARSSRRRPLSATKPHLRRLLATCFAFLLRRAKNGEPLDSLARIILQSLNTESPSELCESTAWLLLESVKSVETHIHSRAPAILRAFIRQASDLKSAPVIQVFDAALTGILHHGRPETLSTVSEVILARFNKLSDAETEYETHLVMDLVCVLSGTRKGNRLADKEKASILSMSDKSWADMTRIATLVPPAVETATFALLNAPTLQSMLDSGRKLLEKIWNLPSEVSI
jgi:U3 small nucleolar RNA-associated protein 20